MVVTDKLKDFRGNELENGDLCIRTSFADKKSVLVYCVVFGNRAFYIRPDWRTSKQDLIDDIMYEGKSITSFTFEEYQIVKLNVINEEEKIIREKLINKLANCEKKGNFSAKYITMAKELLN